MVSLRKDSMPFHSAFYCQQTKFEEVNVFTGACLSTGEEGRVFRSLDRSHSRVPLSRYMGLGYWSWTWDLGTGMLSCIKLFVVVK